MDRSIMIRAAVGLAFALGACGGSVSPDTTTNTGTTTAGTGSSGTGSSGAGTTGTSGSSTATGGDTVGTTSGSVTSTTSSGSVGQTSGSSSGVGSTSGSTTTSTTTGSCDFSNAGGSGGAGGASGDTPPDAAAPRPFDAGTGVPPAPIPANGIVIRLADIPHLNIGSGTGGTTVTTTGGVPGPDPNTQDIIIGNTPISCGDPFSYGQCGQWRVSIGILPQDFHVGLFPLHCSSLNAFYSMTFAAPNGGTDCAGGGGGSFDQGTLEILSITDVDATIRLSGTVSFDLNANGIYRVIRCQKEGVFPF